MSKHPQNDIDKMSFEEAFQALQETVQKLEAGNLALAESLALYERGMALSKRCNQQLDTAELSIKALAPSGELTDFEGV